MQKRCNREFEGSKNFFNFFRKTYCNSEKDVV